MRQTDKILQSSIAFHTVRLSFHVFRFKLHDYKRNMEKCENSTNK